MNTRGLEGKSGARLAKLFEMLGKEFGFQPRKTEEERICEWVMGIKLREESDDEMPVIVDSTEGYLF